MKNYTLKTVFWNDGMLAITFFETVRRDLKLVEYGDEYCCREL